MFKSEVEQETIMYLVLGLYVSYWEYIFGIRFIYLVKDFEITQESIRGKRQITYLKKDNFDLMQ